MKTWDEIKTRIADMGAELNAECDSIVIVASRYEGDETRQAFSKMGNAYACISSTEELLAEMRKGDA